MIELSRERGRVNLRLCCLRMGADLCVTLAGGDREHIGAVALSQPGPQGHPAVATSVLALPGHREEDLARRIAAQVSAQTGAVVCVACGIHLEAIRPEELAQVLELSEALLQALLEHLGTSPE
jgi:hypothetical protein